MEKQVELSEVQNVKDCISEGYKLGNFFILTKEEEVKDGDRK